MTAAPPDLDRLIPDAQAFCALLARNNTRDWWQEHKATYDKTLKAPALYLLDCLTGPLTDLTGHPVTPKLFRPHRDVRFSRDKTPYNTHLHMMWTIKAGGRQDVALFFGIDPGAVRVGAGLFAFDKAVLDDWRQMLDLDGPRIAGAVAEVEAAGFALWESALKRVPPPYGADHPQARLLRYKGLALMRPLDPANGLETQLVAAFTQAMPLTKVLGSIA